MGKLPALPSAPARRINRGSAKATNMAASSSSSSSFAASSLGRHPNNAQPYVSPQDSTWTSTSGTSGLSALTSQSSQPQSNLGALDLGPPGYEATMY